MFIVTWNEKRDLQESQLCSSMEEAKKFITDMKEWGQVISNPKIYSLNEVY